ncbi:MAG: 30S ribosomal protein S18 [Clostridia bacterium]|jgi:small subunit ribosomal protein S18|nr:30S ribosomal protein S18 [Clostridia bacterium]MBQ6425874.1 30S ribosomal protein S18 [Clostridia bacterium]MCR5073911.1 30S ribosomal protein S18 [Clostridiales bacterium]
MEERKMHQRPHRSRRKVCKFCADKAAGIDYKDVRTLEKFMTESGKIMPRRMSGVCARHQRDLAIAIKRARIMALLPYIAE